MEFRQHCGREKTRMPGLSHGVICVILGLAIFDIIFVQLRLVTDSQTDGQTNRHTDRHAMTANTVLA